MARELLILYGESNGTDTTGTYELTSDIIYGTVNHIRIPKGMKAKIWIKKISGDPGTVYIQMTHDITADNPWESPITLEKITLSAAGQELEDTKRPRIVRNNKKRLKVVK